jgi:hydrogenase nickel incorporation protein HypA/HybF
MHEASLAQHIIENVVGRIERGQIPGRVSSINLRVGRLTAVTPDNLRFLFEVLARGSALEGAHLDIEIVPVRARCRRCEARFAVQDLHFACTRCGSSDVEVLNGRELLIGSVEVD